MECPKESIYLDHHATTPVDPRVVEAMLPYLTRHFGNPSATETRSGRFAADAVSKARNEVAALLNAEPAEIVFTSGATEANNLAILGTIEALQDRTDRRRVFTTPIEHKAVLETLKGRALRNFEVLELPIDSTGRVDVAAAGDLIDERTLFVSVQAANNEIGTIQPVEELVRLTHDQGALFHCDAAQAIGKIPFDVRQLGVDLIALSSHKLYGPKGVGALFIRKGPRGFPIRPQLRGGGQEQGTRSGTLNVPGIVGLGVAAELSTSELPTRMAHITRIRDEFERRLLESAPRTRINGDLSNRLPNNSSLTFAGVDAYALIHQSPEIEVSTGSACTTGAPSPSHVLLAIGASRSAAESTLRVGFGKDNTMEEVDMAASTLVRGLTRLGFNQPQP